MFNSNLKLSLCHTCLVSISRNNVFNIFNTPGLAQKLVLCSGLPLETTDEYPENICPKCHEQIVLFYKFQQMCRISRDKFKELLKTNDTLLEESGKNSNVQTDGQLMKHINKSSSLLTRISKKSIQNSDKVQISTELLRKEKMVRPSKKQLANQNHETKSVMKRSSGSVIQETNDTTVSDAIILEDLIEYSEFDIESEIVLETENSSLNKETPSEQININFETEETETMNLVNKNKRNMHGNTKEKSLVTDTESYYTAPETTSPQKLNYQCDRCSKSFNVSHKLEAHIRQHNGLPPYSCAIEGCGRSFNLWHFYNKHQNAHNLTPQRQNLKCGIENCERVYKNKSALNIHRRKFHNFGPELKTHMCEVCGKVFKSSSILIDHQYTHIDKTQLPYACEEEGCCKRFSNKEKLKIHKMRHAGIKNFTCPHCGMRKTTRNELKIHINYHTLERTWPCRVCPKVCNSAGNLKMHVKNMHEGAKDFACRYCERTFAKADTKKYHEMTHTGEKPHECKECGRRFLQPAALRTHRKIHLRKKGKLTAKEKATTSTSEEIANTAEDIGEADITESIEIEILCDNTENIDYS